jgi:ribosomal-protein-alanine N-acetyltransferase
VKTVLRPATSGDLPALEIIENESFPKPHWQGQDFTRYEATVAEVEGQIAGFLISRQTFRSPAGTPGEREILNVATSRRFRRQGVATALLEHEVQGVATWFLEVRESNVAAQNLYLKLGFEEVARRAGYYQNPVETAIVMRLKRC